jgi:hypothetical protein
MQRLSQTDSSTCTASHGTMSAFSLDGEWVVFASEDGGINDEEPLVQ